jgi:probable F420-dependent oxidoreductase
MAPMELPLARETRFGVITSVPSPREAREIARLAEDLGFDSIWVGDHVAFPVPILDPLLQLALIAASSERLQLGTAVYLLPLRHPVPVAKQVGTLDLLCGGRLVFGVGLGGEFPLEFEACGVPVRERGARLSEAIPLLRALWSGDEVDGPGRFFRFRRVRLAPPPAQLGGPPIWCGGRAPAALERIGRLADGWIAYAVDPPRYRSGLEAIASAAQSAGRSLSSFGSGHLLFLRLDRDHDAALDVATEHLSRRYAMDFREPARRYAALGRPDQVAERVRSFQQAGVRHVILDLVGPFQDRDEQLERFSKEVRPLLLP